MNQAPPTQARVVIVGGGIVGSSIAYHLTKLGISDVIVFERGTLPDAARLGALPPPQTPPVSRSGRTCQGGRRVIRVVGAM